MGRLRDRDVAAAILKAFADSGEHSFAPSGYYDDDAEIVSDIENRLGTPTTIKRRQLFRVCNRLCDIGVLWAEMRGTHKYYFGEPTKQREFMWSDPAYPWRIAPEKFPHYTPMMTPDGEINHLLRNF